MTASAARQVPAVPAVAVPAALGPEAALSTYPNPAPDGRPVVRLTARGAQQAVVYVRDGRGRLAGLLTVPVQAGQTELKLPGTLPQGTYFLQTKLDRQALRFILKVE